MKPMPDSDRTAATTTSQRPLDGVRVVDLTTIIFGPSCTQILADYGADVVKIEAPDGDFSRHAGSSPVAGMGPMYLNLNRNKRGVCLDLRRPAAVQALLRLIATADMFISNVRPAGLARLGLGYDQLRAAKPDIVCVSLVGYGQSGPYAHQPAVDDVLQAGSGMSDLFAISQGGAPSYVPMNVADRLAGTVAAHAALAALIMRGRTGDSQHVEVPMFETMVATVMGDHLMGASFVPEAGPMGYSRILSRDRQPFKTADGYISTAIYSEKHWQAFLPAIGHANLRETDQRFANAPSRAKHYPEVYRFLSEQFRQRGSGEWLELLSSLDIPCSRVVSLQDVVADPHLKAVDMFPEVRHPTVGPMRDIRMPIQWKGVELGTRRPAPIMGQHTEEVLRELGYDEAGIEAVTGSAARAVPQP